MATSKAPRQAEGIELLGEYEGSGFKEPRYLVRRSDDQLIQLTDLLYLILERLDGNRSYEQIASEASEAYGRAVSPDNVEQLVEKRLVADGLVAAPDGRQPELQRADPLLALRMRITLLPEGAVNFFAGLLRPLFWPPIVLAVLAGLVAVDVWYFGTHGIGQSLRSSIYSPLTILMLYGLMILSVGWHELGHATACRYGGARPGKIGFGIYIIWPAFYTDVTDIYSVGKAGRVRTDLGGVYFNTIFALATAGVYALTRYEPILVLIMIQHALIFYQFLPFLRLDGYFVFSDLTGIPDLFARIKPTLASFVPWKRSPREVKELKRWVRVVVTLWVLAVIPLLLYLFGMMVLGAPRVLATAWDSLNTQWDKVNEARAAGHNADAAVNGLQALMVVAPLGGMGITFTRVSKRIAVGWGRLVRNHHFIGLLVGLVGAAAIAGAAFLLIPNGEYKPIQPDERWTAGEGFDAISDPASLRSGRPSLTEDREVELGGAPSIDEQESATDDGSSTTDPEETEDSSGTVGGSGSTPTPTPTSGRTSTPTATPTAGETTTTEESP